MSGLVPFNNRSFLRANGFDDFYNAFDNFFSDFLPMNRTFSFDSFKIDVRENENEYLVDAELPGVNKDEISLEINEGRLSISVNREEKTEKNEKNYLHRERRFGSMQRSIYLPDAGSEGITAKFEGGVLNITVPRVKQEEKKNKIVIQ